jgi:hypothetical protein
MSEDDLLTAVLDLARLLGVFSAHFRPARRQGKDGRTRWETAVQGDGKGYPDLTLVGPAGLMFRELKSTSGTCSPEQAAWLAQLTAAGADTGVWRPADLKSGRIESELRALAGKSVAGVAGRATANRKPAWMK